MKSFYSFVLAVALIMFGYLFVVAESAFGQVWVAPRVYVAPIQQVYVAPPPVFVPQQVYVPYTQVQPYRYQRTSAVQRMYRTPLRNALFGRYRLYHHYAPVETNAKHE